ncbi:MAG TPA: LPS assembly lipoprotein LptE [Paenalcaligenes sp.]|nr:LPS assembly lipoprotein LptE [Paenalcaligenes sp.]
MRMTTPLPRLTNAWLRPVRLLLIVGIGLSLALSGCGFKLKGGSPLPFNTLYTNISLNSAFGAQLQRMLEANSPGLRFVAERDEAQATLIQLQNSRRTRDVALDPQGNVEEYQLNLVFRFELLDAQGKKILAPTTLTVTRYLPNDPDSVQAKESERASLYAAMEQDVIERLSRRLTAPDITERFEMLEQQKDMEPDEASEIQWPDDSIDESDEEFLPSLHFE